jgi:hypothetical protein
MVLVRCTRPVLVSPPRSRLNPNLPSINVVVAFPTRFSLRACLTLILIYTADGLVPIMAPAAAYQSPPAAFVETADATSQSDDSADESPPLKKRAVKREHPPANLTGNPRCELCKQRKVGHDASLHVMDMQHTFMY